MPPRGHSGGGLHLSGTRMRIYTHDCRRMWAFEYIAGMKKPPSEGQRKGTALHWVAEHWLRDAIPPSLCPPSTGEGAAYVDEVRARFAAGVPYLPEPKRPGVLFVEEPFSAALEGGQVFTGTIDFVDLGGEAPLVGDHKSTKTLAYVKTVEELRNDPQVLSYGYQVAKLVDAERILFRWVYYRMTGAPYAVPVNFEITRERLERAWRRINEVAAEMTDLWTRSVDPMDVPGNLDACGKYGGCFYRGICAGKGACMSSASEGSSIFQQLKAQVGGGAASAAPSGTSTPQASAADAAADDIFAGADSMTAAAPAINPPAVAPAAPPAAPAAPPTADALAAEIQARLAAAQMPLSSVVAPGAVIIPTVTTADVAAIPAATAEPVKRGSGRPRKSAAEPAPAAAVFSADIAPPAAGTELAVYIGCAPAKGGPLPTYVRSAADLRGRALVGAICIPANGDAALLAVLEAAADIVVKAC